MNTAFRNGSVLVTTLILTAVVVLVAGSIIIATSTYMRLGTSSFSRDKAFFLAEAGLAASVVKLNRAGEGNIIYSESRGYFAETNHFHANDWGFQTVVQIRTNGSSYVLATGRYRGETVDVQNDIYLTEGSRDIHALYAHALYAGNWDGHTNYSLEIGGTNTGADFVNGDVYSGNNIVLSGDAYLRLPELLYDLDGDGVQSDLEEWDEAYVAQTFTQGLTQADFDAFVATNAPYEGRFYNDGAYNQGEAYVDEGNGEYDVGEPFTDLDGDGVRDPGDDFTDENGNGVYDFGEPFIDIGNGVWNVGEEWVEDSGHTINGTTVRVNGYYDGYGGFWESQGTGAIWRTSSEGVSCADWPGEEYEDLPDGIYQAGEPYYDGNGVYDEGEEFYDDRNGMYDYGTQATGTITGMPPAEAGQQTADGGDAPIDPPDLNRMYYYLPKAGTEPIDALERWGYDYIISSFAYGGNYCINDNNNPAHIFVHNPPIGLNGYSMSDGVAIYNRVYTKSYDIYGQPIDDFFLEDPTDPTYNTEGYMPDAIDGTVHTAPMYVDVNSTDNSKLYFVDGNLYLHSPWAYSLRFREPGTRITVVAKGNITISDEFFYNASYDPALLPEDMNSTVVEEPLDALCLIAITNAAATNSGNVYIGDSQFGSGGSIHAMLYAENDFLDNNLDTTDQAFISVFGNMSAGDEVSINRSGAFRTRLDISLDQRIADGEIVAPGLPHPRGLQRSINVNTAWGLQPGTWDSYSRY